MKPGLSDLERLCGVPVAGVIPYLPVDIDDEDSLTERFHRREGRRDIDLAVIRLPKISNFTDFGPFERYENVSLRYVKNLRELGHPDMILLPGTKSTIADLLWLRQSGLEAAVQKAAGAGTPVFGICGGYQMLGQRIADPDGVEAEAGAQVAGMGLLPTETVFRGEKRQTQVRGILSTVEGPLSALSGLPYQGYEIHMGRSGDQPPLLGRGCVYGTYIHGIFDAPGVADALLGALCRRRGLSPAILTSFDPAAYKERQYDLLAQAVRENLDMDLVYRILERKV